MPISRKNIYLIDFVQNLIWLQICDARFDYRQIKTNFNGKIEMMNIRSIWTLNWMDEFHIFSLIQLEIDTKCL